MTPSGREGVSREKGENARKGKGRGFAAGGGHMHRTRWQPRVTWVVA